MDSRLNLQAELEAILGSRNVYFQPPESLKIRYPAIVYSLEHLDTVKADNKRYLYRKRYAVTLIHDDPDTELVESILENFNYCSFDRCFTDNNLYHFVFDLYYKN